MITPLAVSKPRFLFLDGMRGLSALFVVFHHLHQEIVSFPGLPDLFLKATRWLQTGRYAVAVFIVLSGFSLMLPVVRSGSVGPGQSLWIFLKRRMRRIFPPYYAALFFTLLLFVVFPQLQQPTGGRGDMELPVFERATLFSHFLLIHNLNPEWALKINGPLWSVATEWQIYFLFPLLFLPVWRRLGNGAVLVSSQMIAISLHLSFYEQLTWAPPCYIGLFAIGMVAASIGFSEDPAAGTWRDAAPWGTFFVLAILLLGSMIKFFPSQLYISDTAAGLAAASLIMFCVRELTTPPTKKRSVVLTIFENRWAVALGAFSYSIYLVHTPLLSLSALWLRPLDPSPLFRAAVLPMLFLPFALGTAYLFYRLFEKPFTSGTSVKQPKEGV